VRLEVEQGLERSRRELDAAEALLRQEFFEQAISRAYYACFYAAEMALLGLGETRSKHAGVISAFGRLVIREGGLPAGMGELLRSLFEDRIDADYRFIAAPPGRARERIDDARRFVEAVREWIEERDRQL
jgi:uncharacterized protein (UPF0332 family)